MVLKNVDFLYSFTCLSGDGTPNKILVLPDGAVELFGSENVYVNAESAGRVIAAFEDQGVEVPIDYEHASVVKAENGEPAPAAGWIKSMWYEEGVGLWAAVEWTDKAKNEILAKQYKYLSPVIIFDTTTRSVERIHSVALTNNPRIKNQRDLLAASWKLSSLLDKETNMPEPKVVKTTPPRKKGDAARFKDALVEVQRLLATEIVPGVEVPEGEPIPEEATEQLDELSTFIMSLKEILVNLGKDVPEDADAPTIVAMIGELLMALVAEVDSAEDARPAEEVAEDIAASVPSSDSTLAKLSESALVTVLCDKLGMKRGTPVKKVLARVDALRGHVGFVPVKRFNELSSRLGAIEQADRLRGLEVKLGAYTASNKLNPYDDNQMKWAREFALKDPEGFDSIMANAPALVPSGRLVQSTDDVENSGKTSRGRLIASARSEFDTNERLSTLTSRVGWVNEALRESGQAGLTEMELKNVA